MCGRYTLTHSAEKIAARFDVAAPAGVEPRYNVAPTQTMPVVRRADDGASRERTIVELRWGLIPFWAKDKKMGARMINARSETVAEKSSFRAAFKRRRCLVPVDSFYEWVTKDGDKWPIRITVEGGRLGAFAGLWERWSGEDDEVIESYTILTTEASSVLTDLHHRMPVWAPDSHWDSWLFDDDDAEEILDSMVDRFPEDSVGFGPVSRDVNKAANEGEKLVEPVDVKGLPRR